MKPGTTEETITLQPVPGICGEIGVYEGARSHTYLFRLDFMCRIEQILKKQVFDGEDLFYGL